MLPKKESVSFHPMFVGLMDGVLVSQEGISLVPVTEALLEHTAMKISMIVLESLARMVEHVSMKSIHLDVSVQVAGKESCVTQISMTVLLTRVTTVADALIW